jgi:hypothetical protein
MSATPIFGMDGYRPSRPTASATNVPPDGATRAWLRKVEQADLMLRANRSFSYHDGHGFVDVIAGRTRVAPSHELARRYPTRFDAVPRKFGGDV